MLKSITTIHICACTFGVSVAIQQPFSAASCRPSSAAYCRQYAAEESCWIATEMFGKYNSLWIGQCHHREDHGSLQTGCKVMMRYTLYYAEVLQIRYATGSGGSAIYVYTMSQSDSFLSYLRVVALPSLLWSRYDLMRVCKESKTSQGSSSLCCKAVVKDLHMPGAYKYLWQGLPTLPRHWPYLTFIMPTCPRDPRLN